LLAVMLTVSLAACGISNSGIILIDNDGTRFSFDENGNRYFVDIPENEKPHFLDPESPYNVMPFEWPAFNESDFEDNFENYASGNSRVTLKQRQNDNLTCNVVGVVVDKNTEAYIDNAVIYANNEILATTDKNGRFQVTNLPNGVYNFEISVSNYAKSTYLNYPVDGRDGTNIFTFNVDANNSIYVNREDFY